MASHELCVGDYVVNLGLRAKVVEIHPVTGDPILMPADLRCADGSRWLDDAGKCELSD